MAKNTNETMIDPVQIRSKPLVWLFSRYVTWFMSRNFHALRVIRKSSLAFPADSTVVVYSNHPSWWEPLFFIVLANRLFPDRIGYGPMAASALKQYPFMRRLGIFPLEPTGYAGAVQFLRTADRIHQQGSACLWITAQGEFADPRIRPVLLRPGLSHLAARTSDLVFVPLALEYAFWNERFPEALALLAEPVSTTDHSPLTRNGWNELLQTRLSDAMNELSILVKKRDPAAFETLLRGTVGIGGTYDFGRRLKAWFSGKKFDPSHQQELTDD